MVAVYFRWRNIFYARQQRQQVFKSYIAKKIVFIALQFIFTPIYSFMFVKMKY